MSAIFSAKICKLWEAEEAVPDLHWIDGDISSDRTHKHLILRILAIRIPNFSTQLAHLDKILNLLATTAIHGQERNATFPFQESCPIFLERDRTAVPIRKGGKEWERKGERELNFLSFPFSNLPWRLALPVYYSQETTGIMSFTCTGGNFVDSTRVH